MSLIVQKFGGTSVKDTERLRNVAEIIAKSYNSNNDVVVVVSAQGKFTDVLTDKAAEISSNASKREMDMLLSAGEQISISLLAMALNSIGVPAISLLGWQAGFETDTSHTSARIKNIKTRRIEEELEKKKVVVVAGFQGLNRRDDIATLGRGGSDTSAVALAAALKADCCQIYTDVDGVYTADPRKINKAIKLDEITYDEMLELATLGAQVLCNRSVEMAKRYSVNLEVLSSMGNMPGTKVKEMINLENLIVRGVAKDDCVVRISVVGVQDTPGMAFKIFSKLAQKKVNVDIILQSIGRDGTKDITFTASKDQSVDAVNALQEILPSIGAAHILSDENVSKVSIVGAGMESHPGIASKMFEALFNHDINIQMISTSEIKISVLIDIKDSERAVQVVHDTFFNC